MYRLMEYILEEGKYIEFVDAIMGKKDKFQEIAEAEALKDLRDVIMDLEKKMELTHEGSSKDAHATLQEWVNCEVIQSGKVLVPAFVSS